IGLKVTEAGKQEFVVTVKEEDGVIQWRLKTNNKDFEFSSIYQLSLYLKSLFDKKSY
ncbi:MAG: hypothetical protein IIB05_07245, partial [Bacteroidetes bacterium]|nr:hypothetical protein [Bacteroidota bacterium]